jgi:hypothetical protein
MNFAGRRLYIGVTDKASYRSNDSAILAGLLSSNNSYFTLNLNGYLRFFPLLSHSSTFPS